MATTTRGYPLFTGGQAPAIPTHLQQLSEAIDADMGAVATPGGWTTATLVNSWVPSTGYAVPRHRIDRGTVEVQGRVTGGASGTEILVLPPGRRPTLSSTEPLIFVTDNTTGTARVAIWPDGRVVALVAPLSAGMSINIRFSI